MWCRFESFQVVNDVKLSLVPFSPLSSDHGFITVLKNTVISAKKATFFVCTPALRKINFFLQNLALGHPD